MAGSMPAVGWRFQPSDEFLIEALRRLASGLPVNLFPHLANLDLYGPGKEPWILFSGDDEISELGNVGDAERKLREKYIISRIVRIGGKNVSRTAGAGTWLDKGKTVEVGEMGHKKTDVCYEYCGGDGAAAGKSYYYLHEFQLSSKALLQLRNPSFDYVICKVHKDLSKSCRIGKKRKFDDRPSLPKSKRSRPSVPEVVELDHVDSVDEIDDFEEDWNNFAALLDRVPQEEEREGDSIPELVDLQDDYPAPAEQEDDSSIFDERSVEDWISLAEHMMMDSSLCVPEEKEKEKEEEDDAVPQVIDLEDDHPAAERIDEQEDDSSIFDERSVEDWISLAEHMMMDSAQEKGKEDDAVPELIDLEDDHPAAEPIQEQEQMMDKQTLDYWAQQMMDSDDEADLASISPDSALIWGPDFV